MKAEPGELDDFSRLQAAMLRPGQQVNIDGSSELGWGTALVCFGVGPYLNASLAGSARTMPWIGWIAFVPLLCAAFAPYAIPRLIKRFITWPRTGYFSQRNDVKLNQLLLIMGVGTAVGLILSLPLALMSDAWQRIGQPDANRNRLLFQCCVSIVGAMAAIYLGRRLIRKRQPLPMASDVERIQHQLKQTPGGRKVVRTVWLTLLVLFIGVPVVAGTIIFGLVLLGKAATNGGATLPQIAVLTLLVTANAILYLMCNGIAIKQHPWKGLVLAVMALGAVGAAFIIPFPAVRAELRPTVELFPPQATLFMGLMWVVSGLLTLVSFLRRNPLPAAATA